MNPILRGATIVAMLISTACAAQPRSEGRAAGDAAPRALAPQTTCPMEAHSGPLQQYVQADDPAFAWEVMREERGNDGVLLSLSLRSQEWRRIPWEHSLALFLPGGGSPADLALLVLRQGGPAEADAAALRTISRATGAAAAFLYDVPNQPLFGGVEEDPLLAYTYSQYLATGDASWPLLFPMARSVVGAMDALAAASVASGGAVIRRYVVAGHSKRGHAAWLAAAVDPRVAGVIPMSIDVLNSQAQIAHHEAVAGDISGASTIFSEVIDAADTPRGRCLMRMIDPFTYRVALTQPKLVVLATNDAYTPTDALNLYWDGLSGQKSVLYLPNTSHAGAYTHPGVNATAFAFVRAVGGGASLPEIRWSTEIAAGALTVRAGAGATARAGRLWMAYAAGRDFRPSTWTGVPMRQEAVEGMNTAGSFVAEAALPPDGYVAFFGEVEFDGEGESFNLSTPIRVIEAKTGALVTYPAAAPDRAP